MTTSRISLGFPATGRIVYIAHDECRSWEEHLLLRWQVVCNRGVRLDLGGLYFGRSHLADRRHRPLSDFGGVRFDNLYLI